MKGLQNPLNIGVEAVSNCLISGCVLISLTKRRKIEKEN
jgi:hypothetical protein